MHKVATSLPFLFLAVACAGSPEPTGGAVHQLAVACAIDIEAAAVALEGGAEPAPAPDPTDETPSLAIACCTDPDGCTPMDYPIDVCQTLSTPAQATTLALHSVVPYTGDSTTTAFFENCEPPPGDPCDPSETPYVFAPYPHTRWVAAFVSDGFGNTTAELYEIPPGATSVQIPSGAQVFPLLEATDGYADPSRPVQTPDGTRYVDLQNDCIPRADGCGFTCFTC